MDHKQTIIQALDVLRKRDLADKKPFSARAYATVIQQLKQADYPITHYEQVESMKGVGEKIQKKIKEIMETGQLKSAEKAKELYPIDALDAFQKIYGVGPAKATELTRQGFRTIAELRQAIQANPKLLNDKQTVGLKYYEELLERIPHEEMKEHRGVLQHYMKETVDIQGVELVGSFRRGLTTSGDIDVLIRVPEGTPAKTVKDQLATMVERMKKVGYIEEVLAIGEHKCMAICRLDETGTARRLDLLMTPEEEYAYAVLYFTGSDRFNVAFRQYTLEKGYTLNEHTMTMIRPEVRVVPRMRTEKDIFRFLGLKYVEPMDRVDGKQIIQVKKPEMGSQ